MFVNGQKAGTVWSQPWSLEITPHCRAGENSLKVIVANTWRNRLIGDSRLPEQERKTTLITKAPFTTTKQLDAGLLGPVTIRAAVKSEVK